MNSTIVLPVVGIDFGEQSLAQSLRTDKRHARSTGIFSTELCKEHNQDFFNFCIALFDIMNPLCWFEDCEKRVERPSISAFYRAETCYTHSESVFHPALKRPALTKVERNQLIESWLETYRTDLEGNNKFYLSMSATPNTNVSQNNARGSKRHIQVFTARDKDEGFALGSMFLVRLLELYGSKILNVKGCGRCDANGACFITLFVYPSETKNWQSNLQTNITQAKVPINKMIEYCTGDNDKIKRKLRRHKGPDGKLSCYSYGYTSDRLRRDTEYSRMGIYDEDFSEDEDLLSEDNMNLHWSPDDWALAETVGIALQSNDDELAELSTCRNAGGDSIPKHNFGINPHHRVYSHIVNLKIPKPDAIFVKSNWTKLRTMNFGDINGVEKICTATVDALNEKIQGFKIKLTSHNTSRSSKTQGFEAVYDCDGKFSLKETFPIEEVALAMGIKLKKKEYTKIKCEICNKEFASLGAFHGHNTKFHK
jgi:hypothetical protein